MPPPRRRSLPRLPGEHWVMVSWLSACGVLPPAWTRQALAIALGPLAEADEVDLADPRVAARLRLTPALHRQLLRDVLEVERLEQLQRIARRNR